MQKNKKLHKSTTYRAFNQEYSYSKRDLNPHSRNGQRILSPSCLPFHHSSILKREKRAENETRTRDPNLGKVMLYQLSYFRIFSTGAKIMSFLVSAKLSIKKVWQKIFYRPNNAFSACSIPQKLKPSTTCCINAEISSLQRLPILPSCV